MIFFEKMGAKPGLDERPSGMQKSKIVFCVCGNFSRAAEARWVPKKFKKFRQMAGEIKGGK